MSISHESQPADGGAPPVSRRRFLGELGVLSAATAAAGGLSLTPALTGASTSAAMPAPKKAVGGGTSALGHRLGAYKVRKSVAKANFQEPIGEHQDNGDELLYPDRLGSFSKGLPHGANGLVDPAAYVALKQAVKSGAWSDFEKIPLGAPSAMQQRRLCNPQSGLAYDLQGLDVVQFAQPPAPALASAEAAAEAVELYWMARLRDVSFRDYDTHPLVAQAVAELNAMVDFKGPRIGGVVTPQTLFRDIAVGTLHGPYLSQFLLKPVPFGAVSVDQKMRTVVPGDEFMTTFAEWLAVQRGEIPTAQQTFDSTRRHIRCGRDLAQWVHVDVLFQAYFHAALICITGPNPGDLVTGGGLGVPLNPGNPYLHSKTQDPFGTFGPPHIMAIMCEVATRALKAVWYQKWYVHRRLRPEAYAGRVHATKALGAGYPLHPQVLDSQVVADTFAAKGSYLLPMVFPEGSPMHPSYGAGHATVAGACVTVLKAFIDENAPVPNPVIPSADGQTLEPYTGSDAGLLTVGGELNKLASNVATGRNIAGVHWRSDAYESLRLGEQVAIQILQDQRAIYHEEFDGFTFTTFDGARVTV